MPIGLAARFGNPYPPRGDRQGERLHRAFTVGWRYFHLWGSAMHRIKQSFASKCCALVLLLLLSFNGSSLATAQGLVGERYFTFGYKAALFGTNPFDIDWTHRYVSTSNHPFRESWDLGTSFGFEWASGQIPTMGGPLPLDFDGGRFDIFVTKHFRPQAQLDPFARLGVGYVRAEMEADLGGGVFLRDEIDDTGIFWSAGFEYRFSEGSAVQALIRSGGSLEEFDLEEVAYEDLYLESILAHWWNENWLSGFTIGSNFDGVEIALGGFLGFGW